MPQGEQSAAGLAAEFPPYDDVLDPINRVFLPRADIATETLAEGLKDLGWEVEDVTAYRTVRATPPPAPVREAIKTGKFDAVVFTSSSTVRNLVGIAGKPRLDGHRRHRARDGAHLRRSMACASTSSPPSVVDLADALASFAAQRRDACWKPRAGPQTVPAPSWDPPQAWQAPGRALDCSLRSRGSPTSPSSLTRRRKRVCSFVRPGQRRAILLAE